MNNFLNYIWLHSDSSLVARIAYAIVCSVKQSYYRVRSYFCGPSDGFTLDHSNLDEERF